MLADEQYTKLAAESVGVTVDCAGVLADGETVDVVSSASQIADPDGADDLVISGEAANGEVLYEQGRRKIDVGRGLQMFVSGGSVGAAYRLSVPFTTSGGQTRVAELILRVDDTPPVDF